MQTIDLYDTICLLEIEDDRVDISCNTSTLNNAENLAVRAAQMVRQRCGIKRGVLLELSKRIPMAAGLGGGSSDAAAILLALHQWWQLPLSASDLLEMATTLGSDVPFFLTNGLALCEGRGERVTPLAPRWPSTMRWLLLVKPPIAVSTATVFRNLPGSDYSDGTHSRTICTALEAGQALPESDLYNGLARVVMEYYPEVRKASTDLHDAGAPLVRLSGSGPTLFAPLGSLSQASAVHQYMQARGYEVYLSRAIYPSMRDICSF